MKSVIATLGMMAAVASAYNPGRNLHFPRGNGTTSAGSDSLTTLTVKTTVVHTITSCAPTVTNCPAHATGIASLPESAKTTMVVTDTVVLTETVCPVSEAAAISSSVIQKHQTGGLTGVTLAPTTVSKAIHPTGKPSMTTKVTNVVSEKTVTITVGSGNNKQITTSVTHVTVLKTVTVPCEESNTLAATNAGGNVGGQKSEPTTTTTATTKVTRTVTVQKATPTNGGGSGGGNSNGKGGECPASCAAKTVTETVTAPASTVYVTIGGNAAAQTDSGNKPAVTNPPTVNNAGNDKGGKGGKGGNGKSKTSDCTEDITSTIQKVITVVPYPVGNDTKPTSGAAKPSGFARLVR